MINNPIKSLPSFTRNGKVAVHIEVVPMTLELVDTWERFVRPFISERYQHWLDEHEDNEDAWHVVRADKNWDWHKNLKLAMLYNMILDVRGKRDEQATGMCIVLRPQQGDDAFPIGMLLAVPKLRSNILSSNRHRAFTWFLSDAPKEVYRLTLGIDEVKGVAKALLDCTIQAARDEGEDGSLLLKADPKGGDKLLDFYGEKCGMLRLEADHPPVTPHFRSSEIDRYFYFDDEDARVFTALYDKRR